MFMGRKCHNTRLNCGAYGIIVNELVSNAMKYAFEGAGDHALEVTAKRVGKMLNLTVQDNGKGFDVKENPYGFETREENKS